MYIGIISGIIAGIISGVVVYTSSRKSFNKQVAGEINGQGYTVMKGKSNNNLVTYITYVSGAIACGFSLAFITTSLSDALMIFSIGAFLILVGILFNKMTNDNRIEYNNDEIRQYIIFRKNSKTIHWEDIKKVELRDIGPFLVFNDGKKDIVIDFKLDGIVQLLQFASSKLQGKDAMALEKILLSLKI